MSALLHGYVAVAGAGLCGTGSALGMVAGLGSPVSLAAAAAAVGSLAGLIACLMSLERCLRAQGKLEEADRLAQRVAVLEREYDQLKKQIPGWG